MLAVIEPATEQVLAELPEGDIDAAVLEAGLPEGVLNVVAGPGQSRG